MICSNVSEPLEEYYPTTNNVAEIVAVMTAIDLAKKLGNIIA